MDERFVKKLLVPSCVIAAFSTAFIYEFKYLIDLLFFKKKHIFIIGILSAPENFQQRLSIRRTWLQLLSDVSASAYFIIGNDICDVPPYDRVDRYSCVEKPFSLPPNATAQTEFTTLNFHSSNYKPNWTVPSFIGFTFYVRDTIIVKKLGILKNLLLVLNSDVQVKLVSSFDNTVLASVTFNSDLLDDSSSLVITKAIKPIKLNAEFETYLKLEIKNNEYLFNCDNTRWQSKPNVINFIQLWHENSLIPYPFTENSCTPVFMTYTVVDAENIKLQSNNRTLRLKEWHKTVTKLSSKLNSEYKMYDDIMFVSAVDVYRNLSLKLIHFYKRIIDQEYFHYILKTDDDSFIDLIRIDNQLRTVNRESDNEIIETRTIKEPGIVTKQKSTKFWWWSFFKEFWKVERAGKWREDHYRSASYPMFPCGGGYVINRRITDYVVNNHHQLHHFQGEDVSLGIWLSPLLVTHYKTPKVFSLHDSYHLQKKIITKYNGKRYWANFRMNKTGYETMASNLCEWSCIKKKSSKIPLCNKVQLSVKNMYETWNSYIKKGFL